MSILDFFKRKKYDAAGYDLDGYNRLGYNRQGFDRDGYDASGFDKEGYDRDGYDITGFDRDGYDREGFNQFGYDVDGYNIEGFDENGRDRDGYNRNGFDKEGYGRDGYNIIGFDKEGYDRDGFNQLGYNHEGFNREGYDASGYDCDGYDEYGFSKKGLDRSGYGRDGFDQNGFDRSGYDRDGFDQDGFNKDGYDREGYDASGYNYDGYDEYGFNKKGLDRLGYNRDGFDQNGFDRSGYDRDGFDQDGFNKDGYDREGYDKKGYDINGYTKDGYNSKGLDRDGFNTSGYDSDGYDREGYDKDGFNRLEISKFGFKKSEYDKDGYHKVTGCDAQGYFRNGYNSYGINKHTGRDRFGYDSNGIDENGFNIWGFNIDTGTDIRGNNVEKYANSSMITEENCSRFEKLYYRYITGNSDTAIELSDCYVNGNGTVQNYRNALAVLLDSAVEQANLNAAKKLGRHFANGDIVRQDKILGSLLKYMSKTPNPTSYYDNGETIEYKMPGKSDILNEHKRTLETLRKKRIRKPKKSKAESKIKNNVDLKEKDEMNSFDINEDTSWMDRDQLEDWREKRARYLEMRNKTKSRYESITVRTNEELLLERSIEEEKLLLKRRIEEEELLLERCEIEEEYSADPHLIEIMRETGERKEIRSLQLEQKNIIEANYESNIIVQACAGSGAARIMLYRLASLKYNQPDRDWSKVEIIALSDAHIHFLKTLSSKLKISEIEIITLEEYYLQILKKYEDLYPSADKNEAIQHLCRENRTHNEPEDECEILNVVVYSSNFRTKVERIVLKARDTIKNYKELIKLYDHELEGILTSFGCSLPRQLQNYRSSLYIKVLFAYFAFGAVKDNEQMLCVPEGQDISELEYSLLHNINGKKTHWNIYGDLFQKIPHNSGVSSWDSLKKELRASFFELRENYRNSDNISDFCARTLRKKDRSLKIRGNHVGYFEKQDFAFLLKIQILLGNKTVVIASSQDSIPHDALDYCRSDGVRFMTVDQARGLEFNTAFVFDADLTVNEKYIAYTRALNELYIYSVTGPKALVIKKEKEVEDKEHRKIKNDNVIEPPKVKKKEDAIQPVAEDDKKKKKAKKTSKTRKKTITLDTTAKNAQPKNFLQIEKDDGREIENCIELAETKKCESITTLKEKSNGGLLIVVRESWTNDFCFVVEKFDKDRARGFQYLNGVRYKASSYNRYNQEFFVYDGPSVRLIEKDYVMQNTEDEGDDFELPFN